MIRHVLNKLGSFRIALVAGVGFSLIASITYAQNPSPTPTGATGAGPAPSSGVNAPATGGSATTAEAERVIVTGSNIPTAEETGPNPVDTYRAEDIAKLGVRNQTELLEKLPIQMGSTDNQNIANGGTGATKVNLRALLPKETLTLVDGHRIAPEALVTDAPGIDLIPFVFIDHVDILKDGASAIYGADAVAGVFNMMLKHKFRGLEIGASIGNTNMGASNEQHEYEAWILGGTGDDKTDIVIGADAYDRGAIFSRDRDISSNATWHRFGGPDTRSGNYPGRVGGFVFIPGSGTSPLGRNTPTPHAFPDAASDPQYQPRNPADPIPNRFLFNFAAFTNAIPPVDRQIYYGSFTRDLCDKYLTVFADFKYGRQFFSQVQAPTPFVPDPFQTATGSGFSSAGISVPLTNAFNPFTTSNATLPDGTPVVTNVRFRANIDQGPRVINFTQQDSVFDAGLRGQLGEFGDYFKTWNWELGFRYARNEEESISNHVVSSPGLRDALRDSNPATAFNPFGIVPNTAAAQNRVYVALHNNGTFELPLSYFNLNGDLFNLPAGPVSFALGAEYRGERFNNIPDSLNTTFNTIGSTDLQASKVNRDVWGLTQEIRIPVTSPSWNFPGFYSLEFDLAEREEWYSQNTASVGSFPEASTQYDTQKPKFSVRWQPLDASLTLRGTYSEAFHAPTLGELSPAGGQSFPMVHDPKGLTPDPQVTEIIGGSPFLTPETAYEWSYGAVWSPKWVKGLTLSADFYHIDLRNVAAVLGSQFILDFESSFPGFVERDPNTGAIALIHDNLVNVAGVVTEGFDYEAIYQLDTSIFGHGNFGTFTFTANGTYLSRFIVQGTKTTKPVGLAGQFVPTSFSITGSLPRWRGYLSAFYNLDGFETGATVHFTGDYHDDIQDGFFRQVRDWTTLDLVASYTFNLPAESTQAVAGYSKDGGKNVKMKDGKDKNVMPVSSAEGNPCGWRAWLNNTTITLGMNNVFDQDPPFVAGAFESGYDESLSDIRGRFWYVQLKKRF